MSQFTSKQIKKGMKACFEKFARPYKIIFLSLIAYTGLGSSPALGHAASWKIDPEAAPITVRFVYSDGRAMSLSKVRVLSPDGKIFQVGNADREGYFSFLPGSEFEGSDWTLKVTGEEGHEVEAVISASANSEIKTRQSYVSWALVWILVVSVIMNFAFIGSNLEKRMKRRKALKA